MGYPIYDVAFRSSQVAAASILGAILPQAAAAGTGRPIRMRQMSISNTTGTGFGVGWGVAANAGTTPGAAVGTPVRRGPSTYDPPSSVQGVYTTYATNPTAPTVYSGRLWVPGNSTVIWQWGDGEEQVVMPAATAIPFCLFNTGTGQLADVIFTWEE